MPNRDCCARSCRPHQIPLVDRTAPLADAHEALVAEDLERMLQRRNTDTMLLGELAHRRQRITGHQLA